jgi:hypothetical protein
MVLVPALLGQPWLHSYHLSLHGWNPLSRGQCSAITLDDSLMASVRESGFEPRRTRGVRVRTTVSRARPRSCVTRFFEMPAGWNPIVRPPRAAI